LSGFPKGQIRRLFANVPILQCAWPPFWALQTHVS
jgi:hypothetical protein